MRAQQVKRNRHRMMYFLRNAIDCRMRGHGRVVEVGIDEIYLENLWASQRGLCAYTKRPMILPTVPVRCGRNFGFPKGINMAYAASLDRIDSSQGYVAGNVHFICRFINLGKQDLTDQQVRDFIADIITNWSVQPDWLTGLEQNLES